MKFPSQRRALAAAILVASAAGIDGCSSRAEDTHATSADAVQSSTYGPRLFRNDLYTYLKQETNARGEPRYSDDDVRRLVYLATDDVVSPALPDSASGASGEDRVRAYDAHFASIKPSALYEAGRRAPLETVAGLVTLLRERPVHVVVLPGIFSEMIPRTPFDELFAADTTARRAWEVAGATVTDTRFNVKLLADQQHPLTELVRVGSIDDADGTPLVTAAYLTAPLGSLESFGSLDEVTEVYLRRLDRYFEALGGVPEYLYLLGYSRGTPTGLDLLSRATRENRPWATKVKGFISHAGVVYGSQLADAAFAGGPLAEMLESLREFVGREGDEGVLEPCPGGAGGEPTVWLRARNLGRWTSLVTRLAALQLRAPRHDEALRLDQIETQQADYARIIRFAARALGIPLPGSPAPGEEGLLSLDKWSAAYCRNVESFKVMGRSIVRGAESLTTGARTAWWSTHTLPTGPRYFALTATMGDAATVRSGRWELTTNPTAYDAGSVDFRSLRTNYYDLLAAGGTELQDSQVTVPRGRFWPELHGADPRLRGAGFNPVQGPLRTYFMGTLGVHHWGLAFPRAFATRDGLDGNPFPRTTLLQTIATFVLQAERDR